MSQVQALLQIEVLKASGIKILITLQGQEFLENGCIK